MTLLRRALAALLALHLALAGTLAGGFAPAHARMAFDPLGTGRLAMPGLRHGPPAGVRLAGVSLAGLEFAPGTLPGTAGQTYFAPANDDIDYFTAGGSNTIRLPFLWERAQPALNGPLDEGYMGLVDAAVQRGTAAGAIVIPDLHNYGRRNVSGTVYIVAESGGTVTAAHLADFWGKVAARYAANPRVAFEVMNEPHDQDGPTWVASSNAAVAEIRAAGATNLVHVTGIAYSGAHSLVSSGNATLLLAASDPGGKPRHLLAHGRERIALGRALVVWRAAAVEAA